MKVLFMVSGSLRSFQANLQTFPNHDIAVYVTRNDDDTYFNPTEMAYLFEDSRIKYLVFEDRPTIPSTYTSERQKNLYKQWFKFHRLLSCVPDTYDIYVRIRPDVCLLDTSEIMRYLSVPPQTLLVPEGSDRFGTNDQLAIGTHSQMREYSSYLRSTIPCAMERIPLRYKLVLSSAKVIAIAGDSGSGKSTLCKLLRPLFLFDKVLEFETDRYHKWERNDTHWKSMTHLNPDANYLEKLENDTFNLKLGNDIVAVDYDHTSGTFTPPQTIQPEDNILLCGLHTLYSDRLRDLSDLKIYLDTTEDLKRQWKLQRDVGERGYDPESVLAKLESRKSDYDQYVSPQKNHADIIIEMASDRLVLRVRPSICIDWVLDFPCEITRDSERIVVTFLDPTIDPRPTLLAFAQSLSLPLLQAETGFNGILQLLFVKALYRRNG